jgi:glucosylceramidase
MKKVSLALLLVLPSLCFAFGENKVAPAKKQVKVYTTAENTALRLTLTDSVVFRSSEQPLEVGTSVFVNSAKTFQTILGIGGAITDASAETFAKLSPEKQTELINAYYNKQSGIGYSLARTNINSCDFSSESYTYIADGDKTLKTFDVKHDKQYRIPMIKRAFATAGKLTLFASPWSPPAFMKDNNNMLRGGKLLPEYMSTWALYYTKFIKAYEKEGIPVWGISVQNEPMANQSWESCIYSAEAERDFLKYHLGPIMAKEGLGAKKIIVWDHNRDLLPQRAQVIFGDKEAAKYAWGIGFHWYETWSGGQNMFDNVKVVNEAYPDKNLIFTEGCVESFDKAKYQYWPIGEKYGTNMINDLNNGTVAWTDWNILLDEKGGPNHVGNFCFAPIHADTQTGELIYTPSYYYIGHFSKFIRPNAKRVSSATSRSALISTSFVNTDGKMVTVVMNKTDNPVKYALIVDKQMTEVTIPAHAIQSLVY